MDSIVTATAWPGSAPSTEIGPVTPLRFSSTQADGLAGEVRRVLEAAGEAVLGQMTVNASTAATVPIGSWAGL